ncbi:unnamed protein product [Symbiodinium microadriaticum]|nr:unnamed protein product [Symbiodinium microadriaticum]
MFGYNVGKHWNSVLKRATGSRSPARWPDVSKRLPDAQVLSQEDLVDYSDQEAPVKIQQQLPGSEHWHTSRPASSERLEAFQALQRLHQRKDFSGSPDGVASQVMPAFLASAAQSTFYETQLLKKASADSISRISRHKDTVPVQMSTNDSPDGLEDSPTFEEDGAFGSRGGAFALLGAPLKRQAGASHQDHDESDAALAALANMLKEDDDLEEAEDEEAPADVEDGEEVVMDEEGEKPTSASDRGKGHGQPSKGPRPNGKETGKGKGNGKKVSPVEDAADEDDVDVEVEIEAEEEELPIVKAKGKAWQAKAAKAQGRSQANGQSGKGKNKSKSKPADKPAKGKSKGKQKGQVASEKEPEEEVMAAVDTLRAALSQPARLPGATTPAEEENREPAKAADGRVPAQMLVAHHGHAYSGGPATDTTVLDDHAVDGGAVQHRTGPRRPGADRTTSLMTTRTFTLYWRLALRLRHCMVARTLSLEPALEKVYCHFGLSGATTSGASADSSWKSRRTWSRTWGDRTEEWLASGPVPVQSLDPTTHRPSSSSLPPGPRRLPGRGRHHGGSVGGFEMPREVHWPKLLAELVEESRLGSGAGCGWPDPAADRRHKDRLRCLAQTETAPPPGRGVVAHPPRDRERRREPVTTPPSNAHDVTSLAAPEAVRCGALVGRLRPCTSPIGDFNGVDIDELADGAFDGMAGFLDLLDLQTKPSKVQNPAKEHMILGVLVSIRRDKVVLQPTPGKIQLVSLSSTAALQPTYARAYDAAATSVLVLVTLARRLPQKWLAFVDNVAGQWALTKRYGKDPTVNGELVAFWSTAALADCSSCAVEGQCPQRRDLEMARRMGWTRGNTPVKGILQTLARAVIRRDAESVPGAVQPRRRRTRRDDDDEEEDDDDDEDEEEDIGISKGKAWLKGKGKASSSSDGGRGRGQNTDDMWKPDKGWGKKGKDWTSKGWKGKGNDWWSSDWWSWKGNWGKGAWDQSSWGKGDWGKDGWSKGGWNEDSKSEDSKPDARRWREPVPEPLEPPRQRQRREEPVPAPEVSEPTTREEWMRAQDRFFGHLRPLPPDWIRIKSKSTRTIYYYNTKTGAGNSGADVSGRRLRSELTSEEAFSTLRADARRLLAARRSSDVTEPELEAKVNDFLKRSWANIVTNATVPPLDRPISGGDGVEQPPKKRDPKGTGSKDLVLADLLQVQHEQPAGVPCHNRSAFEGDFRSCLQAWEFAIIAVKALGVAPETPRVAVAADGEARRRYAEAAALDEVVIGWHTGSADPTPIRLVRKGKELVQGEVFETQSDEIRREYPDAPIAKAHRAKYNWVAETAGTACGQLFVFRAFLRKEHLRGSTDRRLDTFVAYISFRCGRGLLGQLTEYTRFKEEVYSLTTSAVDIDDARSQLEESMRRSSREDRQFLIDELERLAGVGVFGATKTAEMESVEQMMPGQGMVLMRSAEDVFRAMARTLAPRVNARLLAAAAVAVTEEAQLEGYLKGAAASLGAGGPLPQAPLRSSFREVVNCIEAVLRASNGEEAGCLRVELACSWDSSIKAFGPAKAAVTIRLGYLQARKALHAFAPSARLSKEEASALQHRLEQVSGALAAARLAQQYDRRLSGAPAPLPATLRPRHIGRAESLGYGWHAADWAQRLKAERCDISGTSSCTKHHAAVAQDRLSCRVACR